MAAFQHNAACCRHCCPNGRRIDVLLPARALLKLTLQLTLNMNVGMLGIEHKAG